MGRRGGFKGGTGKLAPGHATRPVKPFSGSGGKFPPHAAEKSLYGANSGLVGPILTVPARRRSWDVFRSAPGGPDLTFICSDLL